VSDDDGLVADRRTGQHSVAAHNVDGARSEEPVHDCGCRAPTQPEGERALAVDAGSEPRAIIAA
jgi:hypothetical protein